MTCVSCGVFKHRFEVPHFNIMFVFIVVLAGVVKSANHGKATLLDWVFCVVIALIVWIFSKLFSKK
jgi:hypothetical protein